MSTHFINYLKTGSLGPVINDLENSMQKLEVDLKRTQRAAKHHRNHRKFPGVPKIRRRCVR